MHVCHFCDTSLNGDYFRNMALGLSRRGVRVSLVELGPGIAPRWLSDIPNVSYQSLNANSRSQYPRVVRKLAAYLREERVDILHTHLFYAGLIGVLTKWFRHDAAVAVMRHHTSVVRMLGSRLHIAADKWMAEHADHLLTVSDAARRYIREVDGVRRKDIDVIHLGFDFEKLSPNADDRRRVRSEFAFNAGDIVIGYIASLVNGKGHAQLLEAFAKIRETHPSTKLFLVGSGMIDELKQAADAFPAKTVIFAGWREDVAACLNAMDIFVQPSLSEAFSQVLIEAMGCGLPVIATHVGGAAEVIDSGINGIMIEADDVAAIEREVDRLCSDESLRRKIADAGRSSVLERFPAERMVEQHFELYKSWLRK